MAVTLTVGELLAALRLGDSAEETAQATRLLRYAIEAISKAGPLAPEVVQNEAAIVLCGYLFDRPSAGRGMAYANALRNSGALSMLSPYVVHRAGNVDPPDADAGDATADATAALAEQNRQGLADLTGRVAENEADIAELQPEPPATGPWWLGLSEDEAITPEELTVTSNASNALVVPDIPQGQRRYIVFGKPADQGAFSFVHYYPDGFRDPSNVLRAWRELPSTVEKNGETLRLLITRGAYRDTASGRVVEAG